ncbi:MAG: signal transduction histidine kinase [Planctomycetota bacterium]|nr:signal transduction histidine kinase [Planctomycetota bacterium]
MGIFSSSKYLEVVIHDLRTPLNVINLALRMIDETEAARTPELAEDLSMIRSNSLEIERMLLDLVDFSRLPNTRADLSRDRFDPRRMLDEVVEDYRAQLSTSQVEVDVVDAPSVVTLDHARAKMAAQKALANVAAASGGSLIRVRLYGKRDRCVLTFEIGVSPRDSVKTHTIDPENFQRLRGTAAERRGLDLSIVGRVSELFGGSARLEAMPGQGTALVLDWPVELARGAEALAS